MTIAHSSPWYRRIGERVDSAETVIWFPHAGGSASPLIRHFRALPPPVNLFAAALPGREGRFAEEMPDSLSQLITILVSELPQLARPPIFVGHSFGALLAYCLAKSCAAQTIGPHRLVTMALASPDQISQRDSIVHLNNRDFAEQLAQRYGGIPPSLRANQEAMELLLPTVRNDLKLLESYQDDQDVVLDIPILAIAGSHDERASAAKMHGWRTRTRGPFAMETLPGDHFFPLTQINRVLELAMLSHDTSR